MWNPGAVCEIENIREALDEATRAERLAYLKARYLAGAVATDSAEAISTVLMLRARIWDTTIGEGR